MSRITHKLTRFVCTALILLGLTITVHYFARNHTTDLIYRQASSDKAEMVYTQRQLKETRGIKTVDHSYPEQLRTPPIDLEPKGYIILQSIDNSDGSAMLDVLNFQCWATRNKLELVEPAIDADDGTLKTDLFHEHQGKLLPLSNAYNMKEWDGVFTNSAVTMNKIIELTEADIHHSNTVIIVDLDSRYDSSTHDQTTCMYDSNTYQSKLGNQQGLAVTNELCFNANKPSQEILSELSDLVATEQERLTVIIRKWPKRDEKELTDLSQLLECGIEGHDKLIKKESFDSKVIQERAIEYIKSQFHNNSFAAIVITPDALNSQSFSRCLECTIAKFNGLKVNNSKMKAFIALHETHENSMARLIPFKMFFRSIYWMSYSIDDWKRDIDYYSNNMSRDEKAFLLQMIASRGSCLVMAGGGRFADQTRTRYLAGHQNSSANSCLFTVAECNSSTNNGDI